MLKIERKHSDDEVMAVMMSAIVVFALGLATFIIAMQNQDVDDPTCMNDSVMTLPNYLLISGLMRMFMVPGAVYYNLKGFAYFSLIGKLVIIAAFSFEFSWLIVGCVAFYRDNVDCTLPYLSVMTRISLIFQIVCWSILALKLLGFVWGVFNPPKRLQWPSNLPRQPTSVALPYGVEFNAQEQNEQNKEQQSGNLDNEQTNGEPINELNV